MWALVVGSACTHKEDEVWIRIYKVGSGLKSITLKDAIDVCLCWGWIDAVRKRFDDKSGRRKRIAAFVEMLKRGETIHPQGKKSSTGRPR